MQKTSLNDFRVVTASLTVLITAAFWGLICAEFLRLGILLADKPNQWVNGHNLEYEAIFAALIGLLILLIYLGMRGTWADIKRIVESGRIDVFIAFAFGVWIAHAWYAFFSKWNTEIISGLNLTQDVTVISVPFLIITLVILRALFTRNINSQSPLIPDEEIDNEEKDLLNIVDKARSFAESVYNAGSPKSFVFGIDAPWGIGKSTFVNFCLQYWKKNHEHDVTVYKFTPLNYLGDANLLEIFIDGLATAIQKDAFVPEIRPLISRYTRLLKEVGRFRIFGISIPDFSSYYTVDDACKDISAVLERFPRKVIVVIDDLDRISFEEIQNMLFIIRKSFAFPNISFVICYDAKNIGAMETSSPDRDKLGEYLEKFINVKISLYIDRDALKKFVTENLERALESSTVNPLPVRQAIGGLLEIYDSDDYHHFLPFIGDIRKLKRLINTAMLFDLQSTDFQNSDFDKRDLINLLLIYIHYPAVFRKIYETETKGRRGFFSLVLPAEKGHPSYGQRVPGQGFSNSEYANSTSYIEYLKTIRENEGAQFLLNQVFDAKIRLPETKIDQLSEDIRTQLACFNGGWTNGRNLETYLELIVNLAKPIPVGQHRFYMRWRDKILNGEISLLDVLKEEAFSPDKGEGATERLWRILVNNARKMKPSIGSQIIKDLVEIIPRYSLIEIESIAIGLRHNLDYFLTRFLNDAGWADPKGGHSGNSDENIKEIGERVFGTGSYMGSSIIDALSQPERGILGIHDLLVFRLSCSADRGGDIFDLTRSLAQHANKKAQTQGDMRDIAVEEMREMSQRVFEIFKSRYIDAKINVFADLAKLELKDLAGDNNKFLRVKVAEGVLPPKVLDQKVLELKTRIGSFIVYQLTNKLVSHGVGCGFYDLTGVEDGNEIHRLMNDYLFDVCFEPSNPENARYFFDYLFRNFASTIADFRDDGMDYIPSIKEFTRVLDLKRLEEYWKQHRSVIKTYKLEQKENAVFVGNTVATYKEYVPKVYAVLDEHLASINRHVENLPTAPVTEPDSK